MEAAALVIDASIIILYFVAITAIGLYMGRKEESLEDYALGGRRIPWWAVAASIIAAETSAATFLGAPAEGYKTRGITYAQIAVGLMIGRVLVGQIFLRPYYTYRVYTVYDFLMVRFGPKSKNYVSLLFLVMRTLASGVRLFVPSLVLVLGWRLFVERRDVQYATPGADAESIAPYVWAIVILTGVTCLYTAIGGIKAVVWTDVIQASLMCGAAAVAVVTILLRIGDGQVVHGLSVLGAHVPEMKTLRGYVTIGFEDRTPGMSALQLVKLLFGNPYTLPAALIGGTVTAMAAFGTDQDMVQRMLTARDVRQSRRSLISAALLAIPITTVFSFIGVLLIAFFDLNPHIRPKSPNDVFGAYILGAMPVVIRGFVLASIFATAMGSLSAALNALATSLTNDWYVPYWGPGRSARHYVSVARVFTAMFAVLMVLVAAAAAYATLHDPTLTIIPLALGIPGYILGPMLGVFLVGMLTRTRGSDPGNVIAVTVGLAAVFVLSGSYINVVNWFAPPGVRYVIPDWMPTVQFTWYQLVGSVTTFGVGVLFRTPQGVVAAASACGQTFADGGTIHGD